MKLRPALIACGLAACAIGPADAQPAPPDPIDALLRGPAKPMDPEEPDTAATGSSKVEPDPIAPAPAQARPAPTLTRPVFLDETGRAPDGPPSPADLAYDSRLLSSAASVRAFQGRMEGGWTLSAGGRERYVLQLVDRDGYVEGAWRDLRRTGALDGSGFIDAADRTEADITLRFAKGAVAVLHATATGWAGQLTEAGRREDATLRRRNP